MWLENLYIWHVVLQCISCCIFLNFLAIYEFAWFYSIYFWFLDDTRSYVCLDGIHASLRFLEFYLSNDPKLKLELWKLAKFRAVRNLVARTVRGKEADGPPFIKFCHQRLCRTEMAAEKEMRMVRQGSADSPRGVATRHPRTVRWSLADGLPVLRRIVPEAVPVGWCARNYKGGRSAWR